MKQLIFSLVIAGGCGFGFSTTAGTAKILSQCGKYFEAHTLEALIGKIVKKQLAEQVTYTVRLRKSLELDAKIKNAQANSRVQFFDGSNLDALNMVITIQGLGTQVAQVLLSFADSSDQNAMDWLIEINPKIKPLLLAHKHDLEVVARLPLAELGLLKRTVSALQELGIYYIGDLLPYGDFQLADKLKMVPFAMPDILRKLSSHGLSIGTELPPWLFSDQDEVDSAFAINIDPILDLDAFTSRPAFINQKIFLPDARGLSRARPLAILQQGNKPLLAVMNSAYFMSGSPGLIANDLSQALGAKLPDSGAWVKQHVQLWKKFGLKRFGIEKMSHPNGLQTMLDFEALKMPMSIQPGRHANSTASIIVFPISGGKFEQDSR